MNVKYEHILWAIIAGVFLFYGYGIVSFFLSQPPKLSATQTLLYDIQGCVGPSTPVFVVDLNQGVWTPTSSPATTFAEFQSCVANLTSE